MKFAVSTLDRSQVRPALDPTAFNLRTIVRRVARADPWKNFYRSRQSLTRALHAVARM